MNLKYGIASEMTEIYGPKSVTTINYHHSIKMTLICLEVWAQLYKPLVMKNFKLKVHRYNKRELSRDDVNLLMPTTLAVARALNDSTVTSHTSHC